MAAKISILALLFLFFSFINAQTSTATCFPASNLANFYNLYANITTQASQVSTTEKVCNFDATGQSCCDDTSLRALKTYWDEWKDRLSVSLKAAYKRFNTKTDVYKLFNNQTGLKVNQLPKDIQNPMKKLLDQLQKFYNNFGNNIGACYNHILPYYAGALCTLCSPDWKDVITLSGSTDSYTTIWNLSNSTCDYIASRCSGISLGQYDVYQRIYDVLVAMNASVPTYLNFCPQGSVLYDSSDQCVRDCSWAVGFEEPNLVDGFGFNFSYVFDLSQYAQQREFQALNARESKTSVRAALMAFLEQVHQEATDAVREFKLAKNPQFLESRQVAADAFYFQKFSERDGVTLQEINQYRPNGGFDIIAYGSKQSSNLNTHAATGSTGQTGSTSGSSHVSSAMQLSLPSCVAFRRPGSRSPFLRKQLLQ